MRVLNLSGKWYSTHPGWCIQELHWQLGSLDVSIHDIGIPMGHLLDLNPSISWRLFFGYPQFQSVKSKKCPLWVLTSFARRTVKPSMFVASIPIFSVEIITIFSVKSYPFLVDPPWRWSWPTSACCCRCWMWIATPSARPGNKKGTFFGGFCCGNFVVPSGNDCYIAKWKMTIEMVNFPMKNGDFSWLC